MVAITCGRVPYGWRPRLPPRAFRSWASVAPFLRIIAGFGVTGGAQESCTLTGRGPCVRSRPTADVYLWGGASGVVHGRVLPGPGCGLRPHRGVRGGTSFGSSSRASAMPPSPGYERYAARMSIEGPSGSFLRSLPRPRRRAAHLRVRRRRARRWDAG